MVAHGGTPVDSANKIAMTLEGEAWVETHEPKVIFQVNGHLAPSSKGGLYDNFKKDWAQLTSNATEAHIIQWEQQGEASGLETLGIQGEISLEANQVDVLKKKINELSKPGMNYKILSIQYVPCLKDREKARSLVREKIYERIEEELNHINQRNPRTPYHMSHVYFSQTPQPYGLMGAQHTVNTFKARGVEEGGSHPSMVGEKVVERAAVEFST